MNAVHWPRILAAGLLAITAVASPLACADTDEAEAPPPPGEEAGVSPPEAGVDTARPPDKSGPGECSLDGFCPTSLPALFPLYATAASEQGDVWAAGPGGIVRWDGGVWTLAYSMRIEEAVDHYGLFAPRADDMWLTVSGRIVRYSKAGAAAPEFRETANTFQVAASWFDPAANALWEVAGDMGAPSKGVYRVRDSEDAGSLVVESMNIPLGADGTATYRWTSLWGFSATDVYAGGEWCPNESCEWQHELARGAIAHYDGSTWTVSLLELDQHVNAMFGTKDPAQGRQLWLWMGYVEPNQSSRSAIKLFQVGNDGVLGDSVMSKEVLIPSPNDACGHILGTANSSTDAWVSNGCIVYHWDGAELDPVATAVRSGPLGRVNGLWAGKGSDPVWIVGEAVQRGVGFAARRIKESTQ